MITTVIPTYRRPHFLARALRSVLQQTYAGFQVIVYDNASGDETRDVVADFQRRDPRVRYRAHPQNIGAQANFIAALRDIDTPYFSMLSDDDVLLPSFYEQALAMLAAHPTAVFAASPVMMVDEHGAVVTVNNGDGPSGLDPSSTAMVRIAAEHFAWTGILFKREALDAGGIDPQIGMGSDLEFLLRLAGRHPIAVTDGPGAIFGFHPDSISAYPRHTLYWPTWVRVIEKVGKDEAVPAEVRARVVDVLERRLARLLTLVAIFSSSRGDFEDAQAAAAAFASRYRSPGRRVVMRLVRVACERVPGFRWLLDGAITRLRWRRGRVRQWQRILDQHARLLTIEGRPKRKDAAA
ncbi:MAG: glycosyltransferase [Candidatus Dormibacteraeota bacterium]|nr:glycosyltransferase [Candidatus Dormibacteraeota bacterium]